MKNISFHNIHLLALPLLMMALLFVSCDDEENEGYDNQELVIPSNACTFDIQSESKESTTTVRAIPTFTDNFSILGVQVKEVRYYIDNELVATQATSPFTLNYRSESLTNGIHDFRADYTVGGEGFRDGTGTYSGKFVVTSSNTDPQTSDIFDISFEKNIKVGDSVHFNIELSDPSNKDNYSVEEIHIFWDNNEIASGNGTSFSYVFNPQVEAGKNYFVQIVIKYSSGNTSTSYTYSSLVSVVDD